MRELTTISVNGMHIAALTVEEVEAMLDAFIIEQLRKETEEVLPFPLTLELPNRVEKEEEKDKDESDRQRDIASVIRF